MRNFFIFGSIFLLFITSASLVHADDAGHVFVVENGETQADIRERLVDEGYIFNEYVFRLVQILAGASGDVQAGGYALDKDQGMFSLARSLENPVAIWVLIPDGLPKHEIAERVGSAIGWDEQEKQKFVTALTGIQWDAFNGSLIPLFSEKFSWSDAEEKAFATMGAFFSDLEYDFLSNYYVAKAYLIPRDYSRAQVANILVSEYETVYEDSLAQKLSDDLNEGAAENVFELVRGQVELLPDLAPLPPEDISIERRNGSTVLIFSTTYWNEGRGDFELVADPKTSGIEGDVARDVLQRIYRIDGTYREKLVGNFLWHDVHLHYHFSDFIEYALEPVDVSVSRALAKPKATFCVRDVDPVDTDHEHAMDSPTYRICGKERQGISIGWGDSYYFTYADQFLDVTDLPAGTYELSFFVNPKRQFEELSYENNIQSRTLSIDPEALTVKVLDDN